MYMCICVCMRLYVWDECVIIVWVSENYEPRSGPVCQLLVYPPTKLALHFIYTFTDFYPFVMEHVSFLV